MLLYFHRGEYMKIKQDEGICTCCGTYSEYMYGDEDYSIVNKDLTNYNNYKNIYVYQCPNCGFISTDITGVEGVMCGDIKRTLEYKEALNYTYLNGLDKELYDNHSAEVPANLYEAYAYVCLKEKEYEKFIRALYKAIDLKLIMARKYRRSQDELGGEEDNDDLYDDLDKLIKQSIEANRKQIDYYYTQIENKNIFTKLIYIENLAAMDKKVEAKQTFNQIIKSYMLKEDLKNYINNILK